MIGRTKLLRNEATQKSNPNEGPQLSLVIPVHNNLEKTQGCLASLRRQQVNFGFEVVVVDDGSGTETANWLRDESGAKVVRLATNGGYPHAINRGVAATCAPLIMVLNNDTILPTNTLQNLVNAYYTHSNVGVIGPSSDRVKGSQQIDVDPIEGDPERAEQVAEWLAEQYSGKVEDASYVVGMAMAFSRETWDQVDGFDERFGLGNFEDDDFSFKVRELGKRILIARDTFIHHLGAATFTALGVNYRELLDDNSKLFLEKWDHHPVMGAYIHLLRGDFPRTIFNCRAALAEDTPNIEILRILGETHLKTGNLIEAVDCFDQLLQRAPRHSAGALLRAIALLELNRESESRHAVATLLLNFYLSDVNVARILTYLANFCLIWDKPEEAQEYYLTALDFYSDYSDAYCGLASISLDRGDKKQARDQLRQAKDNPVALAMLATLFWEEGNQSEAKSLFCAALKNNPRHLASFEGLLSLITDHGELADTLDKLADDVAEDALHTAAEKVREGNLEGARSTLAKDAPVLIGQ